MKRWFLPKITDYWDWRTDSIENFTLELMAANPADRKAHLSAIRQAIAEHVRVLPTQTLLGVLFTVADDLYKTGNRTHLAGSAFAMYLEASAGMLFSLAGQRRCILHYLVDNRFEQTDDGMKRPLDFYEGWFRSAGLTYICPQAIARELMQHDKQQSTEYFVLLSRYITEAIHVSKRIVEVCHAESRHYIFLNADDSPDLFSFDFCLEIAGSPGVVTAIRTDAPEADSKIGVIYPYSADESHPGTRME